MRQLGETVRTPCCRMSRRVPRTRDPRVAGSLRLSAVLAGALILMLASTLAAGGQPARKRPAAPGPPPFTNPLSAEEMADKQAVVETTAGTFVIQLLPEAAPNHVGHFITRARAGDYAGTTFHRAIRYGIIQGGDPISRDPAKTALYGTGGLGVLRAEINDQPMTAGAVAAVLQPGKPDSGGSQFFIAVTDQPGLQGQYSVFGRIVEGIEAVQRISEAPTDAQGKVTERIEIAAVTIRDTPPPEVPPFSTESVEELTGMRAVLETTKGPITLRFFPERAPAHVRNFLRLASLGAYDGTAFHRIVPGFVIQGGMLHTRPEPVPQQVQRHVGNLQPEFNDTPHVKGTLSMARLDDPASASTSFFICTGVASSLDGKYTAFGEVVEGIETVEAIEATPLDGEAPKERIEITRVRIRSPDGQ
jgi:cyclophilin family peptidyl-prolyl cis-trans isomerase